MSTGIGIGVAGNVFQTRAGLSSGGGGTSFLLDDYGADVRLAYSVRKLSSTYSGDAIRVRETPGNTEADIGFDSNGNLDEAALLTHCGSGDGYIVQWYDQSGNGGTLEQTTTGSQPKIVSSGAVIKSNSKPIIEGNKVSNSAHFNLITPKTDYISTTGQYYFFAVCEARSIRSCGLYTENNSTRAQLIAQDGSTNTNIRLSGYNTDTYRKNGSAYTAANRDILFDENTTQTLFTVNGNLITTGFFTLGYNGVNRDIWSMQEFIVYQGDKSSIQGDIETAINTYYSIY